MGDEKSLCALCGNSPFENQYTIGRYTLVKCCSCGLVRVLEVPDEQEKQKINESIYSAKEYKQRYFKDRHFFGRWFRKKLKIIETLKPQKGRILDIGASYGFFLEEAQKNGWDVYGIEINQTTGKCLKNKFGDKVFIGTLEQSLFTRRSFDVITLWDVLEHIAFPAEFLALVKMYLKPDGIICIQAPNIDSYLSTRKGQQWDWLTPGDHIWFFSPNTLTGFLEHSGFKPVFLTTWEPITYFIDSLIGFNERQDFLFELYRSTIVRIIRKFLFFFFVPFQAAIHKRKKGALLLICAKVQ